MKKDCNRKLNPVAGETKVQCSNPKCNSKQFLSKCPCGLNIDLQIEKDGKETEITIFPAIIDQFLDEDSITLFQSNPDLLEEKILNLENVDFTFNNKKVVTNMKTHK